MADTDCEASPCESLKQSRDRLRKLARRSKRKGKLGEKEIASILSSRGYSARVGRHPEPDVVSNFPFALEVKRNEKLSIFRAIDQVRTYSLDNGEKRHECVLFRRNDDEWYAAIKLDDLMLLLEESTDFILNYGKQSR